MLSSTARRHLTPRILTTKTQNLRQLQTSARFQAGDGGAFDPKTTDPHKQKAGQENADDRGMTGTNPTDPSANKARNPQEGGAQGSKAESGGGRSEREGQSGGGSPPKGGKA